MHCAPLSLIPGDLINPSYFWHIETKHVWARKVHSGHSHVFARLTQHDWLQRGRQRGVHKRRRGKRARGSNYYPFPVCNLAQQIQDDMHVFGYTIGRKKKKKKQLLYSFPLCSTSMPCQIWGWLVKLQLCSREWQRVWKMQESLFENVIGRAFSVHTKCQITSEVTQWSPPTKMYSVFIEANIKH